MKKTALTIALSLALTSHANQWQQKVSSHVLSELSQKEEVELILKLSSPEIPLKKSNNRIDKIKNKVDQLKQQAAMTQQPVIEYLSSHGIEYKSFWVSNDILIKAKSSQIPTILSMDTITKAYINDKVSVKLPLTRNQVTTTPSAIEWNVSMVNAPDVWNMGFTGENIIVAGQDTGYDWDHPAIKEKYRGWNGTTVDHNYNWHDSITSPQIVCGSEPCDDHSHGSHTMGTIVGDDGSTNQIGVAPGAKWMGCRNMDIGNGTPATYTECFQWFLEPTDLNGQNPDVEMAPHIINNSWGCPVSEGCNQPDVMADVVNNVVDAGILVVVSAGNDGSGCNTINTPAPIYAKSFTVGSTTSSDVISGFSSRGSVTVDNSNRLKPDISAPGSSVRSANNSGGYSTFSGTSMAGPNVAGVAALVISANPNFAGSPKIIEKILTSTAVPKRTLAESCGGISGLEVPNNTYGWGRVDALAAVNYALDLINIGDFD